MTSDIDDTRERGFLRSKVNLLTSRVSYTPRSVVWSHVIGAWFIHDHMSDKRILLFVRWYISSIKNIQRSPLRPRSLLCLVIAMPVLAVSSRRSLALWLFSVPSLCGSRHKRALVSKRLLLITANGIQIVHGRRATGQHVCCVFSCLTSATSLWSHSALLLSMACNCQLQAGMCIRVGIFKWDEFACIIAIALDGWFMGVHLVPKRMMQIHTQCMRWEMSIRGAQRTAASNVHKNFTNVKRCFQSSASFGHTFF